MKNYTDGDAIKELFENIDEMRKNEATRKREDLEDEPFRKRIREARRNNEEIGKASNGILLFGAILGVLFGWWFGAIVATIIICTALLICFFCYHDGFRKTAIELSNANDDYDAHLKERSKRIKFESRKRHHRIRIPRRDSY